MMLNVPKRANDAMHMSMLDGYDVSLPLTTTFTLCFTVQFFQSSCMCLLLGLTQPRISWEDWLIKQNVCVC